MKKTGILTFHTALNYGAVLQTYALQNFLLELGFENEVIDYICPFIEKCYSPFFIADGKIVNSIVRGLVFGATISKKRKAFKQFLQSKIVISDKSYHSSEDLSRDVDAYSYFVSGSDQVWSPISAGFDEVYFLPFAKNPQKVSYAASIGTVTLTDSQRQEYARRLHGFDCLSVREESARKILKDLNPDREIYVHVDPTLLLPKEQWSKLVRSLPVWVPDRYILVFNVEKPYNDLEYARSLAKAKGCKVVYINDRTIKKDKDIIYVEAPAPDIFLSLFANAESIVTNSFHGTVFSIIFQKDFYVELENKKQRNIRVEGLLDELRITGREIKGADLMKSPKIDWDKVSSILQEKRNESAQYVMSVLK